MEFSVADVLLAFVEWLFRGAVVSLVVLLVAKLVKERLSSVFYCRFLIAAIVLLAVLPLLPFVWQIEVAVPWKKEGGIGAVTGDANHWSLSLVMGLASIWVFGCAVSMGVVALGVLRLQRLVTSARDASNFSEWQDLLDQSCEAIGCGRIPRLAFATGNAMPCVVGLWSPMVILPQCAERWEENERRMVLMHEIGHIKRGDLWLQWIALIVRAVYWFNPVVWKLHRSLLACREEACDLLVVESGAGAHDYARHLFEIALKYQRKSAFSPALAMAANSERRSPVELRIRRLLADQDSDGCQRLPWKIVGVFAGAGAFAVVCAVVTPSFSGDDMESPMAPWTGEEVDLRWSADPFPAE